MSNGKSEESLMSEGMERSRMAALGGFRREVFARCVQAQLGQILYPKDSDIERIVQYARRISDRAVALEKQGE